MLLFFRKSYLEPKVVHYCRKALNLAVGLTTTVILNNHLDKCWTSVNFDIHESCMGQVISSAWRCQKTSILVACLWILQRHSLADVLQNGCSLKFRKFYRKTQLFPVKFMKFLKTPFLQNTFDGCLWSYSNHWKKASDKERLKVWKNDKCEWYLLITAELSESCLI